MSLLNAALIFLAIIAILLIGSANLFVAHFRLMQVRLNDRIAYLNGLNQIEAAFLAFYDTHEEMFSDSCDEDFSTTMRVIQNVVTTLPDIHKD